MTKSIDPEELGPSAGGYSQAILVPPGQELLFISGQTSVLSTIDEQMDEVWRRIGVILAATGMRFENIVKITAFLTSREHLQTFLTIRKRYLGLHRPASSVVVVQSLARREVKFELEAVAALPACSSS